MLVVGLVLVLGGLALVPLPGPGWLIVILGIAIWASESQPASRLLEFVKAKVRAWEQWLKPKAWWVKALVGLATACVVARGLWLTMRVTGCRAALTVSRSGCARTRVCRPFAGDAEGADFRRSHDPYILGRPSGTRMCRLSWLQRSLHTREAVGSSPFTSTTSSAPDLRKRGSGAVSFGKRVGYVSDRITSWTPNRGLDRAWRGVSRRVQVTGSTARP